MAWRTVMIQNQTKLNLHHKQLELHNESGVHSLPLEDVTAIVLESPHITLTSTLLAACNDYGIAVITCDASHMPNGVMLPFLQHSRHSKTAKIQLGCSDALKARIWQRIVQCKISNQAKCLAACKDMETAKPLFAMASLVESGDTTNVEARAAKDYFKLLFGTEFLRSEENTVNAALNYGYAVLRAFVARSQVAYGLLPNVGLHHDSELNAFNLTDDVMEVFRPLCDNMVFHIRASGAFADDGTLSKTNRQHLASLGAEICMMAGKKQTMTICADRMSAGLLSSIEGKSAALLPLPEFIAEQ